MKIDRDYAVATLADLVRIDSRNPRLVEGAPGEAECAAFVAEALSELGLRVETIEPDPGRPSVVGRLAGSGEGPTLMWNGHLDTVGVEGMEAPFEPRIEGGRLHGRGAFDMKGALAACLAAAKALVDADVAPAGDLLVAAVADEEFGSLGTEAVLDRYAIDGAIVVEPTDLRLCLAHKGFVWIEVETRGRAAHGSRFAEGVDANARMGRVLTRLEGLGRELLDREPHSRVGPPSLHVGVLRGGEGPSTYAERCVARVERRTVPGETVEAVEGEIVAILDALQSDDPAFEAVLRIDLAREPFEANPEGPLATAVSAAAADVLGRPPERRGESYWMDAALCAAAGIDTVVIGPHGVGAHAAEEWVDLESCARLAEILARAAVAYCGADRGPDPASAGR